MRCFGDEGIDPADVKLVRHQDWRHAETPYQLWWRAVGRFELYQQIQRRSVFKGAQWLASFVGTPLNETLFVGIYKVKGRRQSQARAYRPDHS